MTTWHISDVIALLRLPPPQGRSSYYISCPCCDSDPKKKHLNINLKKDVFRCPRCGVSGGIFDLYSLCTGVPRGEARAAMERQMNGMGLVPHSKPKPCPPIVPALPEHPMADIDTRHAVYTALLKRLSLAADHQQNLFGRGLTEQEIARLGYKTTPVVGMASLAAQLCAEGLCLAGIPGFYREGESWAMTREARGILIPVRDARGRIQGLQIRCDHAEKRKFRWVSSAEKPDGCPAQGWVHLAGPVRPMLVLTEGPMKADVIHALTGLTVLAVPGVHALARLRTALAELKEAGLREIKTAFDMDLVTNPHVQNGYNSLLALLEELGFAYGTYVWDPRYKGLDDYIWQGFLQERPL